MRVFIAFLSVAFAAGSGDVTFAAGDAPQCTIVNGATLIKATKAQHTQGYKCTHTTSTTTCSCTMKHPTMESGGCQEVVHGSTTLFIGGDCTGNAATTNTASATTATTATTTQFTAHADTACEGMNEFPSKDATHAWDLQAAKNFCAANPECVSFEDLGSTVLGANHYQFSKTCFLGDADSAQHVDNPDGSGGTTYENHVGVTLYVKSKLCRTITPGGNFQVAQYNTLQTGQWSSGPSGQPLDDKKHITHSQAECADLCEKDPACGGWTWRIGGGNNNWVQGGCKTFSTATVTNYPASSGTYFSAKWWQSPTVAWQVPSNFMGDKFVSGTC